MKGKITLATVVVIVMLGSCASTPGKRHTNQEVFALDDVTVHLVEWGATEKRVRGTMGDDFWQPTEMNSARVLGYTRTIGEEQVDIFYRFVDDGLAEVLITFDRDMRVALARVLSERFGAGRREPYSGSTQWQDPETVMDVWLEDGITFFLLRDHDRLRKQSSRS